MNNILPQDLRVFIHAARRANFAAAALELGASPAYVSKRIAMLEDTLKVKLFHRTTRHVAVTERGELMLSWAQRVLDVYDQLEGTLEDTQVEIRGGLRIAASSGLGRNHVQMERRQARHRSRAATLRNLRRSSVSQRRSAGEPTETSHRLRRISARDRQVFRDRKTTG